MISLLRRLRDDIAEWPKHWHLLVDGQVQKVTAIEWTAAIEKNRMVNVVRHDIVGKSTVSTVLLPLDHQWFEGPPLIFETMILDDPRSALHLFQYRYSTMAQALAGHAVTLAAARSELRWRPVYRFLDRAMVFAVKWWRRVRQNREWDWATRRWSPA